MGIYRIDQTSNALIDLSISGNETSISNGDAVLGQYVSGATEANGEITYTRSPLPPGTVSGATDTTFTALANNDIIQQKSGVLVNRTPAQLSVDLLSSVGNGILTNTNGVWGITSLPDPIQTGVNPNDTDFRIPVRNTAGGFDDSSLLERMDQLQSFDATIHHDQGGRDFNIYPTGVLADFITNPANYDFSVVTSSTTNGREGFTEEIFNADITRFNTTVQIVNVAVAVAFTQAQIVTIRVGSSVPVATGVANIAGLQTWSTGTSNVIFTFDTVENAQLAVAAFSQTQARLTVTSTVTTIPVAAYNANGEGMLAAFLDGRLAEGDRVRFTQRAGTTQLLTRLSSDADVVIIDNHLIVDGPTSLNGTVSFGGKITVPEPTDRSDAVRYLDTWRSAIADSGIRGTTTTQSAGGRTNISVTALSGVENAGTFSNWFIWTGVALNDAEDGFGIAVENVVYSTSGTDPFATGTSTVNRPINIQATADQSFHRDVDIANDLITRGDATVSGDTSMVDLTTTGDTTMTSVIDTTNEFTDLAASTVGRTIGFTTYQAFYTSSSADSTFHEFDFLVNATTQAAIEALTPWAVGDRITVYFPNIDEAAEMAVIDADGTIATNTFLNGLRPVSCVLDAANGAIARRAASTTIDQLPFTAHYSTGFRVFNSPTLEMTGNLTVGGGFNFGNSNAIAYVAMKFGASIPVEITNTVTTPATNTIYLQSNIQYAGATIAIVDAINTTNGATVTYRNFNTTTGVGTIIPQS